MDDLKDLHLIDLGDGRVNAYLLDTGDGRVLVDTGFEHMTPELRAELDRIGGPPPALILVTHAHPDHSGGLAELKRVTGAPAAMHPIDGELVRAGSAGRTLQAGPGMAPEALAQFNGGLQVPPAAIEVDLADGEAVPGFPELQVILAPGHCAGQVVLLWQRHEGVLIAADAASNGEDLRLARVGEDFELATRTAARLGGLEFEHAVFGHGAALGPGAAAAFRSRWPGGGADAVR